MSLMSLCSEIGEIAPEWVQVLPSGPFIKGVDGRNWTMRDPKLIVDAFELNDLPMVIDYEHGQEIKAPKGEEAPAAGWIDKLEVRDGQVWARVDWTEKAAKAINSREYRFLSPAFVFNSDKEIINMSSVGLTNKPNLVMQALNNRQDDNEDRWDVISIALGRTVKSDEELISALNSNHSASKMEEVIKVVDSFISKAVFVPAQRNFLIACCRTQGVEEFEKFASNTVGLTYLNKDKRIPQSPKNISHGLSDLQIAVCRSVGVSHEQFLNVKNKEV